MSARKRRAKKPHALVGMFLHTFKDGRLHYQGQIVSVDGAVCLVQWFEWLMGEPTHIQPMSKREIYAATNRLYRTRDAWLFAAEKIQEREERERERAERAASAAA